MISETTTIPPFKKDLSSEKYPWKETGAVQLSDYFTYFRDSSGGFIQDTKGQHYGAITALAPDAKEKRTGISWQISSFRFGKTLFGVEFFEAKEVAENEWNYPNECASEQEAVATLFAALIEYLQKISKI